MLAYLGVRNTLQVTTRRGAHWVKAKSTCGFLPNHRIQQTKTVKMDCERYIYIYRPCNMDDRLRHKVFHPYNHCIRKQFPELALLWIMPHPFQIPTLGVSRTEFFRRCSRRCDRKNGDRFASSSVSTPSAPIWKRIKMEKNFKSPDLEESQSSHLI